MVSEANTETVQIIEEEAHVDKRAVPTGKVRIRTLVDVNLETASAKLEEHQVEITRVPVNRAVERTPAVRTENETVIIPVMEEVLVVEKQLILKEELHVRRRVVEDQVEVPVALHKQRAVVERLDVATETNEAEKETIDDDDSAGAEFANDNRLLR